jgi:hypothetical protein
LSSQGIVTGYDELVFMGDYDPVNVSVDTPSEDVLYDFCDRYDALTRGEEE